MADECCRLVRWRIENALVGVAEDQDMAERLALRVGNKGLAAAAGCELLNVVGSEALQDLRAIGTRNIDDGSARELRYSDTGCQRIVLGQKFRSWFHKHRVSSFKLEVSSWGAADLKRETWNLKRLQAGSNLAGKHHDSDGGGRATVGRRLHSIALQPARESSARSAHACRRCRRERNSGRGPRLCALLLHRGRTRPPYGRR